MMDINIRYIMPKYATPYANEKGELFIEWCGEILKVIGVTVDGNWIVPKCNNETSTTLT